jgi:asparagine synthase (glutamine-hydrolysing)
VADGPASRCPWPTSGPGCSTVASVTQDVDERPDGRVEREGCRQRRCAWCRSGVGSDRQHRSQQCRVVRDRPDVGPCCSELGERSHGRAPDDRGAARERLEDRVRHALVSRRQQQRIRTRQPRRRIRLPARQVQPVGDAEVARGGLERGTFGTVPEHEDPVLGRQGGEQWRDAVEPLHRIEPTEGEKSTTRPRHATGPRRSRSEHGDVDRVGDDPDDPSGDAARDERRSHHVRRGHDHVGSAVEEAHGCPVGAGRRKVSQHLRAARVAQDQTPAMAATQSQQREDEVHVDDAAEHDVRTQSHERPVERPHALAQAEDLEVDHGHPRVELVAQRPPAIEHDEDRLDAAAIEGGREAEQHPLHPPLLEAREHERDAERRGGHGPPPAPGRPDGRPGDDPPTPRRTGGSVVLCLVGIPVRDRPRVRPRTRQHLRRTNGRHVCGIAGHAGPAGPSPTLVAATLARLSCRGPDAHGTAGAAFGRGTVDLVHTRLAIIDLDRRSDQPFTLEGCTLVYNGELYNYRELRRELEQVGHTFRTDSDTEVLLRAYLADGIACVERFEGMWAFALHDTRSGTLVLSRDRFGEKPLHLLDDADGLWFASETGALVALRGRRPPLDRDHVIRSVVHGHKALHQQEATFHVGVRELPPATTLVVHPDGRREEHRYWRPVIAPDPRIDAEAAATGVRDLLIDSMRLRMRSDVPVAFALSGGVDSSSLVSIAAKELGLAVSTFSIIDPDPRYDERENVAATVADTGATSTLVELRPDTDHLERLRLLVRSHDAPVATISYLVHAMLSEAIAASGHRVAISGTGADELLTGYFDHYLMHLAALHGTPAFDPALAAWREHVAPLVRNPMLSDPLLFVRDPGFRDHILLNRDRFRATLHDEVAATWDEEFREVNYSDDLLRDRMLNELLHEVVRVILRQDDLNSMTHSIENRSPFLDRRLVEFTTTIPTPLLIRDGWNKVVLRDAMRGILNEQVRTSREKRGFNASLTSLFDLADPQVREAFLGDSQMFDWFDRDRIRAVLDGGDYPNSVKKFLFSFLSAKTFVDLAG